MEEEDEGEEDTEEEDTIEETEGETEEKEETEITEEEEGEEKEEEPDGRQGKEDTTTHDDADVDGVGIMEETEHVENESRDCGKGGGEESAVELSLGLVLSPSTRSIDADISFLYQEAQQSLNNTNLGDFDVLACGQGCI